MRLAALLLAGVALAGCGSSGSTGTSAPAPLSAPPIAASAPPTTATPAGRVVALGLDRPEGIAYAAGRLVVATQAGTLAVLRTDGSLVQSVPLGGSGRHVRVLGGNALVPLENAGKLAVVDVDRGTVQTAAVGAAPHDVAPLADGRAVVTSEAGRSLDVVALSSLSQVQTLPAGLQPGTVAVSGSYLAAVDVRGRYLYRFRVGSTLTPAGRVAVGQAPTHVVDLGDGTVAVADAYGKAIDVVSMADLRVVRTVALAGAPEGLAASGAGLWVTLPGLDQLVLVSGGRVTRTLPTVRQANSVAVDPTTGTVYVPSAVPGGGLQVFSP